MYRQLAFSYVGELCSLDSILRGTCTCVMTCAYVSFPRKSLSFAMAATRVYLVFVCVAVFMPVFSSAESCIGASSTNKVYTTTDAALSTETVFLVEFQLSCKNKISNLFLNAEVEGKQLPVSRSGDNQYQVSWTAEHKKAPSGTYEVRVYDEEGFSALRKAQRAGEESKVKPLLTIPVDHPGVSKGPWVSTEIVATLIAGLVWYTAYSAKKSIQS